MSINSAGVLRAMKSVVIVADNRRAYANAFCSGFVAVKAHVASGTATRSTLVVASKQFVEGREGHLAVRFSDGVQSRASVIAEEGPFCLLRTRFHKGCEAIKLMGESRHSRLTPSQTFMVTPVTRTTTSFKYAYVNVETLESYHLVDPNYLLVDSRKYFVVSCEYYQSLPGNLDRLTAGPVFNMLGQTIGIVVQNCRILGLAAIAFKVAMNVTELKKLLDVLNPPAEPREGAQSGFKKRKRGEDPDPARKGPMAKRAGQNRQMGGSPDPPAAKRGGQKRGVQTRKRRDDPDPPAPRSTIATPKRSGQKRRGVDPGPLAPIRNRVMPTRGGQTGREADPGPPAPRRNGAMPKKGSQKRRG